MKIEIIPNRLYFTTTPYNTHKVVLLNIDTVTITQEFTYEPYLKDFGPVSLSCVYRFISKLDKLL